MPLCTPEALEWMTLFTFHAALPSKYFILWGNLTTYSTCTLIVLQVSGILVLHVKGIFSQYVICMPHARKRGGDAQGGLWAAGSPQNRSGTFALTNLIPTLAAMSLSSNPAPFECSPPRQKRRVHATTFHLNTWTWRNHINYHANG